MVSIRTLRRDRHLKVFLIAGESSGDAYGAELIRSLKETCRAKGWTLEAVGWGGDLMIDAGMKGLKHQSSINFMGFWEVAKHLPSILANLKQAEKDVVREHPDLLVTIDFPGFNMRLAKRLRITNHSSFRLQWVAPQIWAWKPSRLQNIGRDFHAIAPILPFEPELYQSSQLKVMNVGHPLLDLMPPRASQNDRPLPLVLLPGSRAQELSRHLPVMVEAAVQGSELGLWDLDGVKIAGAPGRTRQDYAIAEKCQIEVIFGQTQGMLLQARQAWIASGTATLEAALLDTPHIVVYRTSWLTYQIAKRLARVSFIALPNILLNKSCVPELIQSECNSQHLLNAAQRDLTNQRSDFEELRCLLGTKGAVHRLSESITSLFIDDSEANQ